MAVFLVFVPSPVFLVKRDWNNMITAFHILFFLLTTLSMCNKMDKNIVFFVQQTKRGELPNSALCLLERKCLPN